MTPDPQNIKALAVELHGRRIGIINRLAGDRHLFSFEQDYIDDPNRQTLSLSFKGRSGGIVTSTRAVTQRLPPFFANLLPEGHLRTYLARRAGVKPEREFFLLAALGADLPGAMTVTPLDDIKETSNRPNRQDEADRDRDDETALRFSLAGVQLKFSAIAEAAGGLTVPANGMGGSWIVKLPSAQFPAVPENEYVMLALARAIGIAIPPNRLVDVAEIRGLPDDMGETEGKALAVERFDRGPNGQRIHMEDFAQVFGLFPNDKYGHRSYANIAAVLWAETGEAGTYEFVRRLAFSVLIGNGDMHLKNWSLLYRDRRTPELSPAYDFVATLPYIPRDRLALSFGDSQSLSEITVDQIRRFTDTAGLPANPIAKLITETAEKTLEAWGKLDQKQLLPEEMQLAITTQIEAVAANVRLHGANLPTKQQARK